MNKIIGLIVFSITSIIRLSSQDMFPARQLTSDPAQQGFATWSPDNRYIVYQYTDMNDTLDKNGLWRVSVDGTGTTQIFKSIAEHAKGSPDGKKIAFTRTQGRNFDIWVMEVDPEKIKKELQIIR